MRGEMQWRSHRPCLHVLLLAKSYGKLTVDIHDCWHTKKYSFLPPLSVLKCYKLTFETHYIFHFLWHVYFNLHLSFYDYRYFQYIFKNPQRRYHHKIDLSKDKSFTANAAIKVVVLSKGRSSTTNSGTKVAVLLGINRYSFLFSNFIMFCQDLIRNLIFDSFPLFMT